MRNGWYIINYHEVSFEDSILTRALGGTLRPDVFARQLSKLSEKMSFCDISEGYERLQTDRLDKPYVSIWFDDGFSGLYHHAADICDRFGVKPAVSICSHFVTRQDMFWRCKLSALAHLDGLRLFRAGLRRKGHKVPFKVRVWSMGNYGPDMLETLDESYQQVTTARFRDDAFRIFLDADQLATLKSRGWDIVNHSRAHDPWAPGLGWDQVRASFEDCEPLVQELGGDDRWWVVPFDFGFKNYADEAANCKRIVVLVGNRANFPPHGPIIYRFAGPEHRSRWTFFRRD